MVCQYCFVVSSSGETWFSYHLRLYQRCRGLGHMEKPIMVIPKSLHITSSRWLFRCQVVFELSLNDCYRFGLCSSTVGETSYRKVEFIAQSQKRSKVHHDCLVLKFSYGVRRLSWKFETYNANGMDQVVLVSCKAFYLLQLQLYACIV